MNKKILLLLFTIFVISVMLISCKKFDTTATNVSNQGEYTSIDPILGQDYQLTVRLDANAIQIGISSGGNPVGDSEIIDKLYQENGSSNYSFQNGIISGNFSILSANQIKISFVRNTPPYLNVRDIICTSGNNANNP